MKVYFKITTWEEVTVDEKDEKDLFEKIKKGEITSSEDVYNNFSSANGKLETDVEEQMTVEENGGCGTIEVYDNNGVIKYTNGLPFDELVETKDNI